MISLGHIREDELYEVEKRWNEILKEAPARTKLINIAYNYDNRGDYVYDLFYQIENED